MPRRMGRKKQWAEDMQARFPEGTFSRISAVLSDGEDRTDFVREAVDRELKRRERKAKADEAATVWSIVVTSDRGGGVGVQPGNTKSLISVAILSSRAFRVAQIL